MARQPGYGSLGKGCQSDGAGAEVKVAILASGPFQEVDNEARCKNRSCRSLHELNGLPLLSYWLTVIKQCPQLLPIEQNVFLLCNDGNKEELRAWASDPAKSAGGFPVENICSNGASTSDSEISDLHQWADSCGVASNLLIISGDAVFSPQFNLNRFLEHSLIRGKDTVAFVSSSDGQMTLPSAWPRLQLDTEGGGTQNPKVTAIDFEDEPSSAATVAPLIFLRNTSLPHLKNFRAQRPSDEASHLGQFLQYLNQREPIFALETIGLFSVGTPEQAEYADQFFRMYAREFRLQKESVKNIKHTESHVQLKLEATPRSGHVFETGRSLTSSDRTLSSQSRDRSLTADDLKRMGDNGPLPLHDLMRAFQERYASAQQERKARETKEPKLPPRFEDASMFKWSAKQEHPVFTTSNNAYGKKGPTQHEMPLKWSGVKGEFTSTQFAGGPNKNTSGFNTSVTKSKVHRLMDDF